MLDELKAKPRQSINHPLKKVFIAFLILILLGAGFSGGIMVGYGYKTEEVAKQQAITEGKPGEVLNKEQPPPEYLSKDVDFNLFWQVWELAKSEYYKKPVSDTKLFYGALAGLIASLNDPHSVYLDPETKNKFTRELSGSYEGIGAEVGIRNSSLTIIAPLPDTPAEKAGLMAGDKVLAIDKADTTGMPLDLAVSLIRGTKETPVVLTIMRKDFEKPRELTIVRNTVEIKAVKWEIKEGNIAYVKLSYFNENATSEFKKAIMQILQQKPKGLILDLRNDPGGFLEVAVDVTGFWIEEGRNVVMEKFNDTSEKEYKASGSPLLKDIKTIVLVNAGSASASEIVAGALQDYQKAVLVGKKTFGKGSVQEVKELEDGSAVKITVAEWLTPDRRAINEVGIAPDVEIDLTEDDLNNDRDPQLDKAMEMLNK